jgi:hypothetical protein
MTRKDKILNAILLCLKILVPLLTLIPLAFFTYRMIEGHIEDLANRGNESYFSGMGLYMVASHVLLFAVNAVLAIIAAVGLLIATRRKPCPNHRKNVVTFHYILLTPVASQVLYVLLTVLILNIG